MSELSKANVGVPIQKTKAEIFAEDPDRFIDTHDLIIAIVKGENQSLLPLVGAKGISGIETFAVAGIVEEIMTSIRAQMRERAQATKPVIVSPNGKQPFYKNIPGMR